MLSPQKCSPECLVLTQSRTTGCCLHSVYSSAHELRTGRGLCFFSSHGTVLEPQKRRCGLR
uniref:Uncharacterized protein n=1 Tax=Anguilla anguilla TaxID=7936 RepID=A0A0E9WMU1_ANGAN